MTFTKNLRVLSLLAVVSVSSVIVQGVMGQTSSPAPSTLDPFSPTVTTTSTAPIVVVPTSTRPPVRSPIRVPSRSPFQL